LDDAIGVRGRKSRFRLTLRQLGFGVVVIAAGVAVGFAAYTLLQSEEEAPPGTRVVTGVNFPYPAGWAEEPLTENDRGAGIILHLDRQDPEATFLARTVVAPLAANFDINALAVDTQRALNNEIEGFKLVSNNVTTFSSVPAVQIAYTQPGEDDVSFSTLMVIAPTANQTYYMTVRAPEGEFSRVEAEGIGLVETLMAYVTQAATGQP
jgi:hypothetical protein